MDLNKIRRMAAAVLKTGLRRIWFNPEETSKIEEAMTKEDVRELVKEGIIKKRPPQSQSRARARKLDEKKKKGRKSGSGKRKGTKKTRTRKKKSWIGKVRAQRKTIKELKKEMPAAVKKVGYSKIYRMIKGNYFKGKKYVRNYVEGKKEAA